MYQIHVYFKIFSDSSIVDNRLKTFSGDNE